MKISSYLIIIALLFISTSCKSKQIENENNKEDSDTIASNNKDILPFSKLYTGSHSNIQEQKFVVLNNENELNTIMATINSTRKPGLEIPKINFNNNSVLGLFMGTKSSSGHAIIINHILQTANEVIVYYSEKHSTGIAASVITQPFYMAKTPKINKTVRFKLVE
jgi:hypothetical protein